MPPEPRNADSKAVTLDDWLRRLEQMHPTEIELGLDRIRSVWGRLPCSLGACRVITIAGTNGKGSTATLTSELLRAHGWHTGLYTSPHFLTFNERIVIDGTPVADANLIAALERVDIARQGVSLTYFEFTTLAALCLFADAGLDAVVLEVGLGGRLDAVNIVDSDVAALTSIGLDHTDWLGDSLDAIAREKSGIARRGKPFLVGTDVSRSEVEKQADCIGAILVPVVSPVMQGEQWMYSGQVKQQWLPVPALPVPSANMALHIVECLGVTLDLATVNATLSSLTMPGRLQQAMLGEEPAWLDVAHNPQAAGYVASHLKRQGRHWRIILGVLKDKDAFGIVQSLASLVDGGSDATQGALEWHLVGLSDTSRGLSAEALLEATWLSDSPGVHCHKTLADALTELAATPSVPGRQTLICGSFHTVAEALKHEQLSTHGFGN